MFPPQAYLNEFDLEDSNGKNRCILIILLARMSVYYWWASAIIMQAFSQLRLPVDSLALTLTCDSCCAAYQHSGGCYDINLYHLKGWQPCLILNLFNYCYCYITDLHSGNVFIGFFKLGKKSDTLSESKFLLCLTSFRVIHSIQCTQKESGWNTFSNIYTSIQFPLTGLTGDRRASSSE